MEKQKLFRSSEFIDISQYKLGNTPSPTEKEEELPQPQPQCLCVKCKANEKGYCIALENNYFNGRACPFYDERV